MSVYGYDALYSLWSTVAGNVRTFADMAAAIALAESGGDTKAYSSTRDVGLWQINLTAHPEYDRASLEDPMTNARAAYAISSRGNSWRPWCTAYADGACGTRGGAYLGSGSPYQKYLHGAQPTALGSDTKSPANAPTIQQGSKGEWVTFLQQYLNDKGYGPLAEDGDFGPKTRDAVIRFQRDHHLTPDGVVGPLTWAVIAKDVTAGAGQAPPPLTLTNAGSELEGPGSRLAYGEPGRLPPSTLPGETAPGVPHSLQPQLVKAPGRFGTGSQQLAGGISQGAGPTGYSVKAPAEPQRADGVVFAKGLPVIENQAAARALTDNAEIAAALRALDALGP